MRVDLFLGLFMQAKGLKLGKNLERNAMGDTTGRVHMESQSFDDFQTRKMKGLKRGRDKVCICVYMCMCISEIRPEN